MNYNSYDNQYSTSYGAQGGAGGGGFFPGDGSQNSPGSANRSYSKDTLRPVTIKQVLEAQPMHQDGDFKIDGTEITQVTFVGQIRNISNQTTNITYKLDDGTGAIEVKQWIDSDASEAQIAARPKLAENDYVRVWGKLRIYGSKRHVGAQIVRPVADFNEISYHLLEATVIHLHFTRGPPELPNAGAAAGAAANGAYGQQQQQQAGYGGGMQDMGGNTALPSMSAAAKKVYNVLKTTPQSNEGLHQQVIAAKLNMDMGEVARAGDELLSIGVIYTTVDDVTWAILEVD
ncbi:replication factor A2 [Glonium stellatum]|uniref:Replication factor A2 n=1 Tax=Glonium stellatum TaxID=574774 RepID=A0A8E2EY28_9PEZI|nr:replication factor A2 [Glonium stellatum]